MSANGYVACGLLVLAITVNCMAVYLQKKHLIYERFGGKAHAVHASVISIFWLAFIVSYVWLETQTPAGAVPFNQVTGGIIKLVAVIIFYQSLKQIGNGALTNKDLFTNKRVTLSGIYSYVREPIYTSYTLFIFGSAIGTGIAGFYYLALISLIGLQLIEAKIESL